MTITNTGATTLTGRQLGFALPAGQSVTHGWGATCAPASGAVTATDAAYDGTLAPTASVTVGCQASHTGNSSPPTAYTLNGAARTVG